VAWSYIGGTYGTSTGSGTTLDCIGALNVATGDLIVAFGSWGGSTTTIGIAATTGDANDLTMEDVYNGSTIFGAMGYKIAASANATATFRMTIGSASTYRAVFVMQFRPDAGETVTRVDGPGMATGTGTAVASAAITATGTDLVLVGGGRQYDQNLTTGYIGADAATAEVLSNPFFGGIWYHLYIETQSSVAASATINTSQRWLCGIEAFNSAVQSGVIPISSIVHNYNMRRAA
jgi:hypothetical protein